MLKILLLFKCGVKTKFLNSTEIDRKWAPFECFCVELNGVRVQAPIETKIPDHKIADTECVNSNQLPPLDLQILATNDDLTTKGKSRLDVSFRSLGLDTRVRPPNAATKLIPGGWRHIRLPEVVFASYGEDLVVMWAFYNYPEAISFEMAANRLLNYKIEIYTSVRGLKEELLGISSANELETYLKNKFAPLGPPSKRKRNTVQPPVVHFFQAKHASAHPFLDEDEPIESSFASETTELSWKQLLLSIEMIARTLVLAYLNGNLKPMGVVEVPLKKEEARLARAAKKISPESLKAVYRVPLGHLHARLYKLHSFGESAAIKALKDVMLGRKQLDKEDWWTELEKSNEEAGSIAKQIFKMGLPRPSHVNVNVNHEPGADLTDVQELGDEEIESLCSLLAHEDTQRQQSDEDHDDHDDYRPRHVKRPSTKDPRLQGLEGIPPGMHALSHWQPMGHQVIAPDQQKKFLDLPMLLASFPVSSQQIGAEAGKAKHWSLPGSTIENTDNILVSEDPLIQGLHSLIAPPPFQQRQQQQQQEQQHEKQEEQLPATMSNDRPVRTRAVSCRLPQDFAGDKYTGHPKSAPATAERPGRPASYDHKVALCIAAKRAMWQQFRAVLTLEDAISLVNQMPDPTPANTRGITGRPLVFSTLRKRSIAVSGLTWSKVATPEDPDLENMITDPCILDAVRKAVGVVKMHQSLSSEHNERLDALAAIALHDSSEEENENMEMEEEDKEQQQHQQDIAEECAEMKNTVNFGVAEKSRVSYLAGELVESEIKELEGRTGWHWLPNPCEPGVGFRVYLAMLHDFLADHGPNTILDMRSRDPKEILLSNWLVDLKKKIEDKTICFESDLCELDLLYPNWRH